VRVTRKPSPTPQRVGRLGAVVLSVSSIGMLVGLVGTPPAAASGGGGPGSTGWVKDGIHSLDIFNPDADSVYYFDGYGTLGGARTVISGQVPDARYWSFTGYPLASGSATVHVHDTEIAQRHDRYTVTMATSCTHVQGTCLAAGSGSAGIVVLRLYVPIDISGAGTGGVPLPTITYRSAAGTIITLAQAAGSAAIGKGLQTYRARGGTLPTVLTRSYPAAAPVPTPVLDPPPTAFRALATGVYANPDNVYEHLAYSSSRGDLVVSATAPTFQAGGTSANDLGRPASRAPQVRYWSLCTDFIGGYTGACLRDQQIHLSRGSDRFVVVVAPSCPVSGYANCLPAGPQPLQRALLYRNLLPSRHFAPQVFKGRYGLTATYVARPG
jgi:hypothetical protein